MESNPVEKLSNPRPIPVYVASPIDRNDDMGLVDLWRVVARRKTIAMATLVVSLVVAVVYLVFEEPVYKATAHLLLPQQQNIQGLLINSRGIKDFDLKQYTPKLVYAAFLDNLRSKGLRREFFVRYNLVDHYVSGESDKDIDVDRIFDMRFNKNLQVQVNKDDPSFVTISFSDSNPELAARWLNQIIDFVDKRTSRQLSNGVNVVIEAEIGQIRHQLDSKLKLAKQRRSDRILTLKEALHVARTLGLKEVGNFPKMLDRSQEGLAINTAEVPLYMRGIDALETEIAVLESRKSDEPFISGFRDIQEKRAFLEGISVDHDLLSAVALDEAVRVPYRKERPKTMLIILLASMLGSFMAIFMVLITESMSKSR